MPVYRWRNSTRINMRHRLPLWVSSSTVTSIGWAAIHVNVEVLMYDINRRRIPIFVDVRHGYTRINTMHRTCLLDIYKIYNEKNWVLCELCWKSFFVYDELICPNLQRLPSFETPYVMVSSSSSLNSWTASWRFIITKRHWTFLRSPFSSCNHGVWDMDYWFLQNDKTWSVITLSMVFWSIDFDPIFFVVSHKICQLSRWGD